MELSFASVELRDLCEKRDKASAAFGPLAASELENRLADIAACETALELMDLFSTDIVAVSATERALLLKAGVQVRFRSGHVKTPLIADCTDWAHVRRIKITAVEAVNE